MSRMTVDWDVTQAPARVVGIPKWNMASLHRNSRILDRRTLRPSACLESNTEVTVCLGRHPFNRG